MRWGATPGHVFRSASEDATRQVRSVPVSPYHDGRAPKVVGSDHRIGDTMTDFLVRLIVNAVALVVAVTVVPRVRFEFGDAWWKLLAVAAIFGLINTYIRPIVSLLSLPLRLITLGAAALVINVAMLLLTAVVSDQFDLGFTIAGWPAGGIDGNVILYALVAAIVISVVSTLLGLVGKVVPRL